MHGAGAAITNGYCIAWTDKAWTRTTPSIATAKPTFPSGRRLINRQRICYIRAPHATNFFETTTHCKDQCSPTKISGKFPIRCASRAQAFLRVFSRVVAGPATPLRSALPASRKSTSLASSLPHPLPSSLALRDTFSCAPWLWGVADLGLEEELHSHPAQLPARAAVPTPATRREYRCTTAELQLQPIERHHRRRGVPASPPHAVAVASPIPVIAAGVCSRVTLTASST